MPRNEDCLDKTTSRMLAPLRFTQVRGAYHVAAWLNQRRVADSQRPSIGTAQGSRCEPDGPFRCDHQWGSSAGVGKMDESGGCVALKTCCVSCFCSSRRDCQLGQVQRVSMRLGDVRPVLVSCLYAAFSPVFALGGVFMVERC
jgi:hypothetical protein